MDYNIVLYVTKGCYDLYIYIFGLKKFNDLKYTSGINAENMADAGIADSTSEVEIGDLHDIKGSLGNASDLNENEDECPLHTVIANDRDNSNELYNPEEALQESFKNDGHDQNMDYEQCPPNESSTEGKPMENDLGSTQHDYFGPDEDICDNNWNQRNPWERGFPLRHVRPR